MQEKFKQMGDGRATFRPNKSVGRVIQIAAPLSADFSISVNT